MLICLLAFLLPAQTIDLDTRTMGRTYEGIGALSAGASSKLLIDYPEPQRSQLLDLLFKPRHGAALQQLKVEIGGDVNSTCGTEPAFAHTREEFARPDFRRGYERWLIEEAHRRSPAIQFDALQWGAPAWIGDGKFYSRDNAEFIAAFHRDLDQSLGLKRVYQGVWNEMPYDTAWIKLLRRTLDAAGLSGVLIGAADQAKETDKWRIVDDAAKDPELARAIYAYGDHYLAYQSTLRARMSGKPLWSTEDGPWSGDWYGATKLAKFYNRVYIDGRMTRTITWALITSYYDILPLPGGGLMRAVEPWSGHFEVQPALWAAAHTTQFTEPGWQYIDSACRRLEPNGSVVALRSPDGQDYTIVVETMDSAYTRPGTARELIIKLDPALPLKPVEVWRSGLNEQFIKVATIQPRDGVLRYSVSNESIFTFSTLTGRTKAAVESPESRVLPLPYTDNFDDRPAHGLPKYFIDQSGVFEWVSGGYLRQMVPAKGIEWQFHPNPEPYTVMGDERWKDYEVEVSTRLEGKGNARVYGRITNVSMKAEPPAGYWLDVSDTGAWALHRFHDTLAKGTAAFRAAEWQTIGLRFEGSTISARINGKTVTTVTDRVYNHGLAGFGCGWQRPYFDNFSVRPIARKVKTQHHAS